MPEDDPGVVGGCNTIEESEDDKKPAARMVGTPAKASAVVRDATSVDSVVEMEPQNESINVVQNKKRKKCAVMSEEKKGFCPESYDDISYSDMTFGILSDMLALEETSSSEGSSHIQAVPVVTLDGSTQVVPVAKTAKPSVSKPSPSQIAFMRQIKKALGTVSTELFQKSQ